MFKNLVRQGRDRNHLWDGHDQMAKARYLVAQIAPHLPPETRLLDIACGDGQMLAVFGEQGRAAIGIDLSEPRLARCLARGVSALCADMGVTLPFAEGSFGAVTLISALEHVPQPEPLLREIARVLAPGGVVAVQIPNPHFPIDLHYMLPLYGYLPAPWRERYRRLFASDGYAIDYYTRQMTRHQAKALFQGWQPIYVGDYSYPPEVAPAWLRPWQRLGATMGLTRVFPTGHLLIFRVSPQRLTARRAVL